MIMANKVHVKQQVAMFIRFIVERHNIYLLRKDGIEKPWTKNPILQQYRFCNVYRELDTVTQWIAKNWRKPNDKDPYLWFAMVVARLINWPDTLGRMTYKIASPWKEVTFQHIVRDIQEHGGKAYSGAYIVSTNGRKMLKEEYLALQVLSPLWNDRVNINAQLDGTLQKLYSELLRWQGLGSFMAAQVVADMKYSTQYRRAKDWWTFAASGPGSRRGLNRIAGRPVDVAWSEPMWYDALCGLAEPVNQAMQEHDMPKLHNQDLQNCLCEFDKYERVRLGQGKPRSLYPGI